MKLTVIVPTYRRPQDLANCLEGLKKQTRLADQIIVTVRDIDTQTWTFLETFNPETLPLNIITVTASGVIAALNMALDSAQGDIISITDDDAVPRPEWLARIEAHFLSDDRVGGVGGRDFVYRNNQLKEGSRKVVGRLQWFGRVIGNHNFGVGEAREVDVLKGVNMSFRRKAIGDKHFDTRMRGTSSQIHYEIEFCLALKRAGWKLIYDPNIQVDHYQGQRFDEDKRNQFNELAMFNIVHNKTLAVLDYLSPIQRSIFVFWAILVGTRGERGLIQWLRFLPTEGKVAGQKFLVSIRGHWQGWQTWQQSKQSSPSIETLTQHKS
ncbi:glycosyl transferase 2 family protein [Lyngbya aestuarii BL J]|uniref:Glycosyl transferase 2 family protein n=1 Tax=Lyngbya aestuarii BL J TaxID=1348334 RepID=U7QDD1_9CYAN|nr:glycosyltransferase family 2 protein [Lyngbya aestuarii]ERT04731.1 glycosyl transferase 2 family protein [Lyngbya aestuarii BL J]